LNLLSFEVLPKLTIIPKRYKTDLNAFFTKVLSLKTLFAATKNKGTEEFNEVFITAENAEGHGKTMPIN
jgi:hypothetical protein